MAPALASHSAQALRSVFEGRDPHDREAVAALAADGLLSIENGIVSLPR